MINFLLPPYPDEIFYSWFGRYHNHVSNLYYTHTNLQLFNINSVYYNISFPKNLDYLCSQLPKSFNITPKYIIDNHTLFPFFAPYINSSKLKNKIIYGMKTNCNVNINQMLGINANNIFNTNIIKICPNCYASDFNTYGEGYIHRQHQIPGCFICVKHKCSLLQLDISKSNVFNKFFHIDNIRNQFHSLSYTGKIDNEIINFTQSIISVLNGKFSSLNLEKIKLKLNNRVLSLGYKKFSNLKSRNKILNDFLNYYSYDLLNMLKSNIDISDEYNWISLILLNRKEKSHPVRYILLINFLFGNLDDFAKYNKKFLPFGKSPWPCLNPVCKNYKKNVIKSLHIKHNNCNYCAIFTCTCGFSYSIIGPIINKNEFYKSYHVVDYGHLWKDTFKDLLLNKHYRKVEIKKYMHCGKYIVSKFANKLKPSNKNLKFTTSIDHRYLSESEIIEYKNSIINYINNNPGATRSNIQKHLSKQYSTLLINHREWFEKNMPLKQKKELNCQVRNTYKTWHEKDLRLSKKLIETISILKENPNMMISLTNIHKQLNYYGIYKKEYASKLPISRKIVASSLESYKDFIKRKLTLSIKNFIESGGEIELSHKFFQSELNISQYIFYKYNSLIKDILSKMDSIY